MAPSLISLWSKLCLILLCSNAIAQIPAELREDLSVVTHTVTEQPPFVVASQSFRSTVPLQQISASPRTSGMHPLTVLSLAEQNLYQDYVLALEAAISAGVLVSDIYAATTALVLDSDVLTAVSDQDLTFGAQTSTVSMATVIMVSDMESPFSAHSEITIQGQPFIYTETNEVYLKLRDDVSPASALGLLIRNTDTDLDTLAELLQRDRLRRESIRNRKPLR